MTWTKNNLWVVIISVFFVTQITLAILRDVGMIPWHLALAIRPILTVINVVLIIVSCVIFLNIDN